MFFSHTEVSIIRPTLYKNTINLLPEGLRDAISRDTFPMLCVRVGMLLGIFLLVDHFMLRIGDLPEPSFREPYLSLEILKRLGISGVLGLGLVAGLLSLFGGLLNPWSALKQGIHLRWFITFLAFLMAWPFSTYGYNFYFDQGHYIDRLLVIICLALVWFRPVFIFPFLILVFTLMWQIEEPGLGGTVYAHKLQVLHVLNLFAAMFFIHAVTGSNRIDVFVLLACSLVATAYWVAAVAKLELNWLMHGQLYHMPLSAYAHGWLSFLDSSWIVSLSSILRWIDWPMRIFVIAIEAGFILFLLRRSLSYFLLIAIIIFHIGVFLLYGFLFWTWILLDAALLAFLWFGRDNQAQNIFKTPYLLLSFLLISTGSYWANPPLLAWYDTRLSYTYKLDGITESGVTHRLPARYFAPYEDIFTMVTFSFLVKDRSVLVGPYGATHRADVANALVTATTAQDIFEMENKISVRRYNKGRNDGFKHFVTQYVSNRNAHLTSDTNLSSSRWSFPQFWSYTNSEIFNTHEPIKEVVIKEITTLFNEQELKVIRETEIDRLVIPTK